jgi:hypothetical protein
VAAWQRFYESRTMGAQSYLLKYVNAAIANKTIAVIQSDESLIPVFFAMTKY